jgi:hypothetical protein
VEARLLSVVIHSRDFGAGNCRRRKRPLGVDIPGTAAQLLIALLFVVPGSVYQAARSRLRGPTADDVLPAARILRALAVSAFLDALYALFFGSTLVGLATDKGTALGRATGFAAHPRETGAFALLLLFVVPVVAAIAEYSVLRRGWRLPLTYDPTPRAWDFAFADIEPTYVRVLTVDGTWLGGWYGESSFVSSFPEPREMFIETAHLMEADGTIGPEQPGSNGLYVRCDDIRAVEFVDGGVPMSHNGTGIEEEADHGDEAR